MIYHSFHLDGLDIFGFLVSLRDSCLITVRCTFTSHFSCRLGIESRPSAMGQGGRALMIRGQGEKGTDGRGAREEHALMGGGQGGKGADGRGQGRKALMVRGSLG